MPENVFVRGESKSIFEGMTKEQILAAIAEAIEGGTISDIDTGFVTTIKEQNSGAGLKFWVGTTAQYNALTEYETNVLYIKTDDTSAADISNALAALADSIETETENLFSHSETQATTTNLGHVKLVNDTDAQTYTAGEALAASVGYMLKQWIIRQHPIGGMLMTSTSITEPSQVAGMIGYGTWSYYGQLLNTTSQIAVNVFIRTA